MRTRCPDEERLADYLEGRLSEKERSHVEEHLAECEICLEGLAVITRLVQDRDRFELDHVSNEVTEAAVRLVTSRTTMTQNSLMEKLKESVNNIGSSISVVLCPGQGWRPAPVRGSKTVVSDDCVCLKVSFEEIDTEIEILRVEKKIRNQIKKQMEQTQREYYLTEQIKAIQKELGKKDEFSVEIEELRKKIKEAKMSKEANERALRELKKLEMMLPMSAEATVVRNYLDWLITLPWQKRKKDKGDQGH